MARPGASLCSLLFVGLCALGAGPATHAMLPPLAARSAVELALRDVADAPLPAPRSFSARLSSARLIERGAPSSQLPAALAVARATPLGVTRSTPAALALQDEAHAARPRWRTHDAAAPPVRSPIAR